jgi:hypothetical protein
MENKEMKEKKKLARKIGLILKKHSIGDLEDDYVMVDWREVVKDIGKLLA